MRCAFLAAGLALLALGGCEARQGAVPPASPRALAVPEPQLIATARFDSALARAEPDARRLGEDRDALAARAAALQDRARQLRSPVMPEDARSRLEQGVTNPPAIPASPADSGEDAPGQTPQRP